MTRLLTALGLVLTAAASFGLYQVKYQVQDMERNLASMKRQIVRDRAEMQVLDAEWSFLNKPERLQELSGRYLALAPIRSTQMASIESLPPRGAPVLAAAPAPGPAVPVPPASQQPAVSPGFNSDPSRAQSAGSATPAAPAPTARSGASAPVHSGASALMISGGGAANEDITSLTLGGGE